MKVTNALLMSALACVVLPIAGCGAPPSDAPADGENLGQTSQALDECATGDKPNEIFDATTPGVLHSFVRPGSIINAPCGRVETSVEYDVPRDAGIKFGIVVTDLDPPTTAVQCLGEHVHVEVWRRTTPGHWQKAGPFYDGLIAVWTGTKCIVPEFSKDYINATNPNGEPTDAFRVHVTITHVNGTFGGVKMIGSNEGYTGSL